MTLEHLDAVIAFAVVMLGVSLLITILTQLISTLLGLRGTNLRWGIEQLIETIHPDFKEHARGIAEEVLHHPLISDSTFSSFEKIPLVGPLIARWKLASAIRVEELIGVMEKIGAAAPPAPADLSQYTAAQAMREIAKQAKSALSPELEALRGQMQALAGALPPLAAAAGAGAGGTTTATVPAAPPAVQVDELLKRIPAAAETALSGLKSWFDPLMKRVAQRFSVQMRIWTVVFSIVVAFALHLDAFRLMTQLGSDAQLRASLVASSDALAARASQQFQGGGAAVPPTAPGPHVPAIYADAMKKLGLASPPPFDSRETAITWLRKEKAGDPELDSLVNRYQSEVDGMIQSETDRLLDRASSVKAVLAKTGFQLIPDPYPGWNYGPPFTLHFWGTLAAAALLSLGAPFWFNMLKNLSSLRPLLASRAPKEDQQSAA